MSLLTWAFCLCSRQSFCVRDRETLGGWPSHISSYQTEHSPRIFTFSSIVERNWPLGTNFQTITPFINDLHLQYHCNYTHNRQSVLCHVCEWGVSVSDRLLLKFIWLPGESVEWVTYREWRRSEADYLLICLSSFCPGEQLTDSTSQNLYSYSPWLGYCEQQRHR